MTRLVDGVWAGARLDAFVADALDVSTSEARRRIGAGYVLVDGRPARKGDAVVAGQSVDIAEAAAWLAPFDAGWLHVVFADADVVVVDKPAGVACHPLERGEGGTLVDAVAARFGDIAEASAEEREAGLVHRLDTGTSGLIAIARTRASHQALRAAITAGRVERSYLAVVAGSVERERVLDAPIAHDAKDARRMVCLDATGADTEPVRGRPRSATTRVRPLSSVGEASLVEVTIVGGRRHQVRVHLASAGRPLLGDVLYGGPPLPEFGAHRDGHALHASALALPGRSRLLSPLPDDLVALARHLGLELQ